MKISTTNPLLAILEASRRDFLRRAGGTAVAAATKGPMGALKSVMGGALKDAGGVGGIIDKLAHISDEELSETPEAEWINIIPSERLANMVKSGKYNPSNEVACKIHAMLSYGFNYVRRGGNPTDLLGEKLPDMLGAGGPQTGEVVRMMMKSVLKTGIDPKQLMDDAVTKHDWLYDGWGSDSFGKDGIIEQIKEYYDGLNIPFTGNARNDVIKKMNQRRQVELAEEGLADEDQREHEEQLEQSRNKPEEFNPPNDYYMASPMHQPFENRLTAQLNLIFG